MSYNPGEEGAPCWGRREERHCRCRWGRREERRGLHAHALPHLRMPLPMGKKRGVPWSACSCAAAPPSAIADVGEEGRSAAADAVGEEERSVAVSASACCHTSGYCRWGRRWECSSCLTADRSSKWRLNDMGPFQVGVVTVGVHDGTGDAPPYLSLLHPCPGATESCRAGGVERERERERFFGLSGRGQACSMKMRTGGRAEIFLGRRRTGSEIFLVVAAGISNQYPKLILGISCL
jgi:hypothetical protein